MAGGGRVDGGEGGRIQLEVGRAGVLDRLRGRARAAQGGADPAVAGGPGDHQLCALSRWRLAAEKRGLPAR
ncbi:hypothetical protein G6F31_016077 [Rhizopus arrhizus]|nr:hypothetical protein G6F31_016077 [Rhizopus arrhizus]